MLADTKSYDYDNARKGVLKSHVHNAFMFVVVLKAIHRYIIFARARSASVRKHMRYYLVWALYIPSYAAYSCYYRENIASHETRHANVSL